jgi:hypothetical protein
MTRRGHWGAVSSRPSHAGDSGREGSASRRPVDEEEEKDEAKEEETRECDF